MVDSWSIVAAGIVGVVVLPEIWAAYLSAPELVLNCDVERAELGFLMGNKPLCIPAQGLSTKIQDSVVACSCGAAHCVCHQCPLQPQFSSVTQSCPTLCDPMNRSTPGLPVHHQLSGFTQTLVH